MRVIGRDFFGIIVCSKHSQRNELVVLAIRSATIKGERCALFRGKANANNGTTLRVLQERDTVRRNTCDTLSRMGNTPRELRTLGNGIASVCTFSGCDPRSSTSNSYE